MNNADMPAMPFAIPELHQGWESGLTKREAFAMAAMQGYAAAGSTGMPTAKEIAQLAVATADAILAELESTGGGS